MISKEERIERFVEVLESCFGEEKKPSANEIFGLFMVSHITIYPLFGGGVTWSDVAESIEKVTGKKVGSKLLEEINKIKKE